MQPPPPSKSYSGLLLEALARAKPGDRPARNNDCCNCRRKQDDMVAFQPGWEPQQCESWVGVNGRVYVSGLCRQCREQETEARIGVAVGNGESRAVAERRFGINHRAVAERREARRKMADFNPTQRPWKSQDEGEA